MAVLVVRNSERATTRRRAMVAGASMFGMLVVASLFSSSGSASADSSLGGSGYVEVAPARLLDTRSGSVTTDGRFASVGSIGEVSTLDLKVTGRGGVPASGVGAVVLNVTAVDQSLPTYLTVFPTGAPRPTASNLNPTPGVVQANLVIARVSATGEVSIYNNSGTVNVIADVQGWFPTQLGNAYTSLVPARILETRDAHSTIDGLANGLGVLGAGQTLDLTVVGRGGVPASGVGAVVLNITATNQSQPTFLTVFPTGSPRPNASNLNPTPPMTASNLAIVRIGAGGSVSIYNDSGSVDVIVDVQGWFPTGIAYTSVQPARVLETRSGMTSVDGEAVGGGALAADSTVDVRIAGRGGVPPTGVSAVVLNVTATNQTERTFLTVFPAGGLRPATSNLNPAPAITAPNLVIAGVGANGEVSIYNNAGSVDVIVDVFGWFPSDIVASNDTFTIAEGAATIGLNVLSNDIDRDGGTLTIASVTQPSRGTVALTGGADAARTGVTYTPDSNYCNSSSGTGPDTFTYMLNGGFTASVAVTVDCFSQPPIARSDAATFVEDGSAAAIVVLANDTDVDGGWRAIASATDPAHGTVLLSGGLPGARTALTYQPDADYCNEPPGAAADTFDYTLIPGGSTATVSVWVTCVNDAPLVSASAGSMAYVENAGSIVIDSGVRVADPDSLIAGATVAITTNFTASQDDLAFTDQLGLTGVYHDTNGVLTLSGTATVGAYQTALRSVTYVNVSDAPTALSRTIEFQVTEASAAVSNVATRTISVAAANDAPANSMPSAQPAIEDTALVLTSGNGNQISISDVDAGVGVVKVTVSALHGTITPAAGSGSTVVGSGTASVEITGNVAQVNVALSTITYTPSANFNGADLMTIVTNDQGNSGGSAKSDTDNLSITIPPDDDQPIAAGQTFGSAGSAAVQTNMAANLTGLLATASDADSGDTGYVADFLVESVSASTTPVGGTVTLTDATAGSFRFDPPPGVTGPVTFTYVISNTSRDSESATVTVYVGGSTIWFADDNAVAGGSGTLSSPFNSLAAAVAAIGSDTNERVFLYDGTYATAIPLNTGGWMVGQQSTGASFDAVMGVSPPVGTVARPAIATGTATVQGTVTLALNAKVQGIAISTTTAPGLVGTSGTGIDVSQTSVTTTTGTAVDLNNARGTYNLSSVSTNLALFGIRLANLGASSMTVSGGTIVGSTTRGVDIDSGTGNFTFNGTISTSGINSRAVEVTNHTAGTIDFNGLITDTVSGINLTNNAGSTINFDGGLAIHSTTNVGFNASATGIINMSGSNSVDTTSGTAIALNATTLNLAGQGLSVNATNGVGVSVTGAGAVVIAGTNLSIGTENKTGFSAINAGSVTVTGTGHTISTSDGTALNITGTTIGSAGVTFQSISASGGTSGVILNGTGSAAGLTVTGSGGVCTAVIPTCTGGLISATGEHGISLVDTRSPSFALMRIQSAGGNGVDGTGTTNFAFTGGYIDGSGQNLGADAANISFGDTALGTEANLTGVVTITGNTLTNAYYHGIDIFDHSGTISNADISNNTIISTSSTETSKGVGVRLIATGSESTVANVTRATISNNIVSGFPNASGILLSAGNVDMAGPSGVFGVAGSSTDVIAVTGNLVAGFSSTDRFGASAIAAVVNGMGQGNFDISNNGTADDPIGNSVADAISVSSLGFANVTATVANNNVDANNTSQAAGIRVGTSSLFGTDDTPTLTVSILGNTIRNTSGNGIVATARYASGRLDATIKNNTVAGPLTGNHNGIRVDAGNGSSLDDAVCLDISGNTSAGSGPATEGIGLYKQGTESTTNDFGIRGMAGTSSPDVETFVSGQNPASQVGTTDPPYRVLLMSATSGFTDCTTEA